MTMGVREGESSALVRKRARPVARLSFFRPHTFSGFTHVKIDLSFDNTANPQQPSR